LSGTNVMVDRNILGYLKAFINERDSHNAFVDDSIGVEGLPTEAHTIRLEVVYHAGQNN
jgi:hypothetical protein